MNPSTERVRTVAAAERARDHARFLAEASHTLASSLDYEATLTSVARLAVPTLGDWCLVDVVDEDGRERRVALAPADADDADAGGARSLSEEIDVTVRAQLRIPLVARGRAVGAITLINTDAERDFGSDDVVLATALAERAALAVDNARRFREAERASAAKSEFLAAMSHEFRTPLNVIMGYADLVTSGIPEPVPEVAREQALRIRRAADHLLQLVEQVLSLSRLDAERDAVRVESVSVGALLREMSVLIEPLAHAKGLRLDVQAAADDPVDHVVIATDVGKVRQILYNLLANAVKFTSQGTVTLALRSGDGRCLVDVRDTGPGIAPRDLTRIFDAFWQASTDRRSGVGLGLSISQRLARVLGGELSAMSTLGVGTTMTLQLPLTYMPVRPGAQATDASLP